MSFPTLEPVARAPIAGLVAGAIRDGIVEGSFPARMQLTEVHLAEQLKVSRGPVREAFQRLIQEGLLVSEPHRGVFVVSLDAGDVDDIYRARRAIEREAARQLLRRDDRGAVGRLDALVKEMAAAARSGTWSAIADVDLAFHEALVDESGSDRLRRMYATLLVETRLCLAGLRDAHPEPKQVVAEHRAVVRALRSGDEAEALRRVDAHLDRAATGPTKAG